MSSNTPFDTENKKKLHGKLSSFWAMHKQTLDEAVFARYNPQVSDLFNGLIDGRFEDYSELVWMLQGMKGIPERAHRDDPLSDMTLVFQNMISMVNDFENPPVKKKEEPSQAKAQQPNNAQPPLEQESDEEIDFDFVDQMVSELTKVFQSYDGHTIDLQTLDQKTREKFTSTIKELKDLRGDIDEEHLDSEETALVQRMDQLITKFEELSTPPVAPKLVPSNPVKTQPASKLATYAHLSSSKAFQPQPVAFESEIKAATKKLESELEKPFFLNKKRKQHKIDGLNSLLAKLKEGKSPQQAVQEVEKQFKDIRRGIISHRTRDLLDTIRATENCTPVLR